MNLRGIIAATALLAVFGVQVSAADAGVTPDSYRLQPGDVLLVSVWKEQEMQGEVLIRPDGGMSFPLAGDITAATRSVEEVRVDIEARLKKYIPDVAVTVSVKAASGNRVYVVGKVARPGDFPLIRPTDVMQALSLAGGTTPFADTDSIRILRREAGKQRSIEFKYSEVERGRHLEQNIVLQGGDTVVVP